MTRILFSILLLALPAAAGAACSGNQDQAMSCMEGTIWDPQAEACVPVVTG